MEHDVAHLLLLHDLQLKVCLLFLLDLQLFTGLINDSPVEILAFLLRFLSQLRSHLDLLIKDFSHLFLPLIMLCLLILKHLLVEALAKLLNLSPFVFADVRRQVIHLHCLHAVGKFAKSLFLKLILARDTVLTHK